jgi:hypothetical protein
LIQKEFFDSSDSGEEAGMMTIMSIQHETDREVEQILNFKGSIKGRRVLNQDRVSRAWLLYKDYFALVPAFPDEW